MSAIDLVRFVCAAATDPFLSTPLPGGLSAPAATLLLARCAVSTVLPLHGRLRATQLLGARAGGPVLLARLLRAGGAADSVRTLAAQLLGACAEPMALGALLAAAGDPAFPLARCAAARALGACGCANVDAALLVLVGLTGYLDDVALVEAATDGLGALGDPTAIPALAALLSDDALVRMRRAWSAHAPLLAQRPPAEWPLDALPPPARLLVATLLAAGETAADLPGGLDELLLLLANRVSRAAAHALAQIGGGAAREALYVALLVGPRHDDAPALLECLAVLDPAAPLKLLGERNLDPMLRWLVARHCAMGDAAALEQALAATSGDPFARGAFVLALRGQGDQAATIVQHLATSTAEEPYVREQALAALVHLNQVAAELLLLPLVSSAATPPGVRCAAAAALPAALSHEARALLEGLLRDRQLPDRLCAALLTALGATRDRAVLPVLLRYCQSSAPETARAALDALAMLADPSALPVLVGLSQAPGVSRTLRLHAAGTLLLLGGEEFLPLLRPAIEHGTIAFQFQALGYVLRALPACPLLPELLRNRAVALPLRRLVAGALPANERCASLLCALLGDEREALALRVVAANRLTNDTWAAPTLDLVLATLATFAAAPATPPALRWRCIIGLGRANTAAAQRALGAITVAVDAEDHSRNWAAQALLAQWTASGSGLPIVVVHEGPSSVIRRPSSTAEA